MTRKVLIIDDEPAFALFITKVVTSLGFVPKILDPGHDILEKIQEFDPDIICLDIVMPELDGIEIIDRLAAMSCRARIIIISGFNLRYSKIAETIAKAKGLLVVSILAKPLAVDDLKNALLS